jgi:hypothetical protein
MLFVFTFLLINLKDAFVKKLFNSPSLYVKWLKALEISMRSEDDFASITLMVTPPLLWRPMLVLMSRSG